MWYKPLIEWLKLCDWKYQLPLIVIVGRENDLPGCYFLNLSTEYDFTISLHTKVLN